MWIKFKEGNSSQTLHSLQHEHSNQSKVIIFNAGIWEICFFCNQSWLRSDYNISDDDVGNCAEHYRINFKRLLNLIALTFPSDLKIFRTTNSAWMRWGNFGFAWKAKNIIDYSSRDNYHTQAMVLSPHVVKIFNDIALHLIRDSGYEVKMYDIFWMTWSRPDDTEVKLNDDITNHMVHLGHDTLKASLRKLITIVSEHLGCFRNPRMQHK